jgi:hypothetical protein
LFIVSPGRFLCSQKAQGRGALPELETRRPYLAPDREESQLWKSAPDGGFESFVYELFRKQNVIADKEAGFPTASAG